MQEIIANVSLPREILSLCRIREKAIPSWIRKTIAIELYRENQISLGKAAELADVSIEKMMHMLASKEIPVHYSREDLKKDVEMLEKMNESWVLSLNRPHN